MSSMITLRARVVAGGVVLLFLAALVAVVSAGSELAYRAPVPPAPQEHVRVLDLKLPVDWTHGSDALPPAADR